jgi:hypothetical protein
VTNPSEGFLKESRRTCNRVPKVEFPFGEVRTRPMAWEVMPDNEVPTALDWRNVNGVNYLSWSVN